MRVIPIALILGVLVVSLMGSSAAAQAGSGSVTGRVVVCRFVFRPLDTLRPTAVNGDGGEVLASRFMDLDPSQQAGADQAGAVGGRPNLRRLPPMAEVGEPVSSTGRSRTLPTVALGVPNVEVRLDGTAQTVRTDAAVNFELSGVPAGQPVTVAAHVSSQPNITLKVVDLVLSPGQTLDVGALSLSGCASAAAAAADTTGAAAFAQGRGHNVVIEIDGVVLGDPGLDLEAVLPLEIQSALLDAQPDLTEIQPAASEDQSESVEGPPAE
jgi:hypothetical protein